MKCKFCDAELEEGSSLCPVCGRENTEDAAAEAADGLIEEKEAPQEAQTPEVQTQKTDLSHRKKPKVWQIVLAAAGGIVLLAVLTGAVLYGLGVDFRPREQNIQYKDSYSVSDEKAEKGANTVIATMGDRNLINAELQVYYQMGMVTFAENYGQYMGAMGLDFNKPMDQQIYDKESGMTWQQFFLDSAIRSWQRYTAIILLAQDKDFSDVKLETEQFLKDAQADLEKQAEVSGYSGLEEMIAEEMGAGANLEGYLRYMRTYYESLQYYEKMYEDMTPAAEEAEAYFKDHAEKYAQKGITLDSGSTVDVRHILISPKGGTKTEAGITYSEEEWEACRQEAQKILDQWLSGNADEKTFGALAAANSEDPGSRGNGGLYMGVSQGEMVPEFDAWCFADGRKSGDHGMVKTPFGYHIMYFVNSQEIWRAAVEADMLTARTTEMLEKAVENWPMEVNYKKITIGEVLDAQEPTVSEPSAPVESAPSATAE